MLTNNAFCYLLLILAFALVQCYAEKLTPLLPGDPYNVVGEIEGRQLGRCNYSYAWLAIPTGSHQDIYAHAAACSRLELRFLDVETSPYAVPRDTRSLTNVRDHDYSRKSVEDELNRVNKDYASQLVDLATLDALLVAVKVEEGVQSNPPLATDDRLFYLADRLGQFKMLAMLRPGRLPKIEIIPPPSQKSHFYPRFVLCYRKMCLEPTIMPSVDTPKTPKHDGDDRNINASIHMENMQDNIQQLIKAKHENQRLHFQVIIYRIVFALAAFLCLLFAITALVLCFRLRKVNRLPKTGSPRMDTGKCYRTTPMSTGFYMKGKSGFPPNSPLVYTDPGGSLNVAHMQSDTASLHNTALSSTLSNCELMAANGVNETTYPAFLYQYTSEPPMGAIPVRQLVNGGQNVFIRSISPASSSVHMEPSQGFRGNSLDRRSEGQPDTPRRRTPLQGLPHASESQFNVIRPYSGFVSGFKTVNPSSDQTINSQASTGTVFHRYSTAENGYGYSPVAIGSTNGGSEHATHKA